MSDFSGRSLAPRGDEHGLVNTSRTNFYGIFDAHCIPDHGVPCVVSATDVAKAHVQGLDVKEAGGHRFICHGDSYSNQLVIDAAKEKFPERASKLDGGWEYCGK